MFIYFLKRQHFVRNKRILNWKPSYHLKHLDKTLLIQAWSFEVNTTLGFTACCISLSSPYQHAHVYNQVCPSAASAILVS